MGTGNPAMNRWAIFGRPYGAGGDQSLLTSAATSGWIGCLCHIRVTLALTLDPSPPGEGGRPAGGSRPTGGSGLIRAGPRRLLRVLEVGFILELGSPSPLIPLPALPIALTLDPSPIRWARVLTAKREGGGFHLMRMTQTMSM